MLNLNPAKNSILEHKLKINSNNYIPINNECLPNGSIESVINTPFDFTNFKKIDKEINNDDKQLKIGKGYDHCFVLNKNSSKAAELSSEVSGRKLIIFKLYNIKSTKMIYICNFDIRNISYRSFYFNF